VVAAGPNSSAQSTYTNQNQMTVSYFPHRKAKEISAAKVFFLMRPVKIINYFCRNNNIFFLAFGYFEDHNAFP